MHNRAGFLLVEWDVDVSHHDDADLCLRYLPDFRARQIRAGLGRPERILEWGKWRL